MPFKKPFIVGEGKKMKRLLPSKYKNQSRSSSLPSAQQFFFFEDFFHHFRFCFWDLLKTNLKEKVIIFKSLQEFFSPARNWLWFLSHRKKWRKLIEFYFQWDCALFRFYDEIKWIFALLLLMEMLFWLLKSICSSFKRKNYFLSGNWITFPFCLLKAVLYSAGVRSLSSLFQRYAD